MRLVVWCSVALASLALAACSPPPATSQGASANTTAAAPAPTTSTPAPATFDAGERRVRELAAYAEHLGLTEVPDVKPVRFVTLDERPAAYAACMAEQGYPQGDDGSYSAAQGQEGSLRLALYVCEASYPLVDKYEQPYTAAQKRIIYDYFASTLLPCLESKGVEVPPLPLYETFLASIGTPNEYSPHAYVGDLTPKEMRELDSACPFLPPSDELWG